jgi:two-component system cell cycle sensor histidine kinase/response regulator CckA
VLPGQPAHETIASVSRGDETVLGPASNETPGDRAREDEVRFRDMAEWLPQLVWTCDLQGICDYLSPQWAAFTGVPVEKHIGRGWIEALHPDDRQSVLDGWQAAFESESGYQTEFRLRRHDGTYRWFDTRATPLRAPDGKVRKWLGSSTDITNRRLAEDALRESEARFRVVADSAPVLIWMSDTDAKCNFFNRTWLEFTGRELSRELGDGWAEGVHPEDREACIERYRRAFDAREKFLIDYRLRRHDGVYRWMDDHGVPRYEPNGEFAGYIGSCQDVTDVIERRRLELQLHQSQKMESIGKLAGGVAHDFNNLLTVIEGNVEIVKDMIAPDSEAFELLSEVQRANEQAAALTRQLLAFSRLQIVEPKVFDLNTAVASTAKMLGRVLGEDVELVTRMASDLPLVRIDPSQCAQVLMNLAVNARDAMPSGGRLVIETRAETREAVTLPPGILPGRYAAVVMTDTGHGMTDRVQAHLFEPFFTTKEVGRGTGLGLAVVHGIVTEGRGFIEVESRTGKGSQFRVYLPAIDEMPGAVTLAPQKNSTGGRERLLLVEDDEAVRRVGLRVLNGAGYDVVQASTAEEALAYLESHPEPFDLLVTDVVMPGMSGPKLAEVIRRTRPAMRIIFISGYAGDEVARKGISTGDVPFVQKPYLPSQLLARVREVLDAPVL